MANLNISIEHGQPQEFAAAKFQSAIREAQSQYSGSTSATSMSGGTSP
jgi:hypothetical protein